MQVVFWLREILVCCDGLSVSDEGILLVRRRFMSFKDFWYWELARLFLFCGFGDVVQF